MKDQGGRTEVDVLNGTNLLWLRHPAGLVEGPQVGVGEELYRSA